MRRDGSQNIHDDGGIREKRVMWLASPKQLSRIYIHTSEIRPKEDQVVRTSYYSDSHQLLVLHGGIQAVVWERQKGMKYIQGNDQAKSVSFGRGNNNI